MAADVGQMFYTGEMPWHGMGTYVDTPATLDEALKAGGLEWEVGKVGLLTADDPPSPVRKRMAIVRLDRPPGDNGRALGVAHPGFQPIQNRDGALLFGAIFGQGRPVYHTGGYLHNGEVVWLLAQIDRPIEVAPGDVVQPYALLANSHDGSMAFTIRLTTVRVVCRNTLARAMGEQGLGEYFRRSHHGSLREHAQAAQEFFSAALQELDYVGQEFAALTRKQCQEETFQRILNVLLPEPRKPHNAERNPGLLKVYENRLAEVRQARQDIAKLRETGQGMSLEGSRGTFWGVLNAVLEYVDHHKAVKGSRLAYALVGEGMNLKTRAFQLIQEAAQAA